jgi:hypothetical protein
LCFDQLSWASFASFVHVTPDPGVISDLDGWFGRVFDLIDTRSDRPVEPLSSWFQLKTFKWSGKNGQSVKVYSNMTKEYQTDQAADILRSV